MVGMKKIMRFAYVAVVILLAGCGQSSKTSSASIRVSFLQAAAVRADTVQILRQAGCSTNGLAMFERVLDDVSRQQMQLRTDRFPQQTDGYCRFDSGEHFPDALREYPFAMLDEDGINCIAFVAKLAKPLGFRCTPPPAQEGDTVLGAVWTEYETITTNEFPSVAAALFAAYPDDYRYLVEKQVGPVWDDEHIATCAPFSIFHPIRHTNRTEITAQSLMEDLANAWTVRGIRFPRDTVVVTLNVGYLNDRLMRTIHMGLAVPRGNGFMYLEKAGYRGPFIRIDLQNLADLAGYYGTHAAYLVGRDDVVVFMAANDRLLCETTPRPLKGYKSPHLGISCPPHPQVGVHRNNARATFYDLPPTHRWF